MSNESSAVYLDNAATSFPKPESVYQAVHDYLRHCGGSPGRGSHRKARQGETVVVETRKALAALLHVKDVSRLIFTCNATESLNLVLRGVLRANDHVVITDLEHNAVVRPLWNLRHSLGIRVSIVESDGEGFIDPQRVARALTDHTRLVCCVHANNVLGTIQPVAEIGRIAREHGSLLLVDASQSAGALPVDVDAMNVDLLAFTGHKGLLGPPGTGGLFVRAGVDVEPLKRGGTGVSSEAPEPPDVMPDGYEAGTYNTPGLAGLQAGVSFIQQTGVDQIRAHEVALNSRFMELVQAIPGVRLYGPRDARRKVGITLLNLDPLEAADVGRILDRRYSVMGRAGLHCAALSHRKLGTEGRGAVRFSFGYFTTEAEVDRAVEALREIAHAAVS